MDYKSTWTATVTAAKDPQQQLISVCWADRAPATYPAAILGDILADCNRPKIRYISDAETGELIYDPEYGYAETWEDFNSEPAIIFSHDDIATCYTWTPYHGIKSHSDYGKAAGYLDRNGWRY